jgi:hypothetical protein
MRWFIKDDNVSPSLYSRETPVAILRLVRDKGPIEESELMSLLVDANPDGWLSSTSCYASVLGLESLNLLKRTGLIEELPDQKLQVRKDLNLLQHALDVSLTELVLFPSERSFPARPLFGIPEKPKIIADVFVAMPFSAEMSPVYEDHILPVVESLGLRAVRADNVFGGGSVINDIWSLMLGAQIVVADCTGRNPNVFYELGMAHTIGKTTLLMTQDLEDIPFDIRHLRRIEYTFTPRGAKVMEEQLRSAIEYCKPSSGA